MSVKLLVDMNLSTEWVAELNRHGWHAFHWSTVGDPSAEDSVIMAWARANGFVAREDATGLTAVISPGSEPNSVIVDYENRTSTEIVVSEQELITGPLALEVSDRNGRVIPPVPPSVPWPHDMAFRFQPEARIEWNIHSLISIQGSRRVGIGSAPSSMVGPASRWNTTWLPSPNSLFPIRFQTAMNIENRIEVIGCSLRL